MTQALAHLPAVAGPLLSWMPAIAWLLSRISGIFPFAIVEVFVAVMVVRLLGAAILSVVAAARRRRRWRNALACGALRVGAEAGVLIGLFYLLWGAQYSRPLIERRLEWANGPRPTEESLERLAIQMIEAANEAYVDLHGAEDAGAPTAIEDPRAIDAAAEDGWRRAAETLGLSGMAHARYGRSKRLLGSHLLHRIGISGFYCPFTGEANLNAGVPAVSYPHVVAHEKSHQRGVCPENEANFFGYLVAALAPHPASRYSAYVFAQRQLLFALMHTQPELVGELVKLRIPGVQRDVDDLKEYWGRYPGLARTISRALNDLYLRSNRVQGGVQSYGRSVRLLVAFSEFRGGRLAPVGEE